MTDIFDVLSDETRRTILLLLRSRPVSSPEVSVSQIVAETGLPQPAVSKQLKVLRDAGLVSVREEGQHRLYKLDATPLHEVESWLATFGAPAIPSGRAARPASARATPRTTFTAPTFILDAARDLGAAVADLAGKAPWR